MAAIVSWETGKGGQIRVVWEDGHAYTFPDLSDIHRHIRKAGLTDEALALSYAVAKIDGGGDVKTDVEGKRVTLDWADPQPVKIEPVATGEVPT